MAEVGKTVPEFKLARAGALNARHAFKTENDDEAKRFMFPQNERLKKE